MLLGAAMKQADVRIDPLHHLAVEFKHEAQDAVRGRMLGPKLRPSCALVPSAADLKFAPSKTEIPCVCEERSTHRHRSTRIRDLRE